MHSGTSGPGVLPDTVLEHTSNDLGETWSKPRNISAILNGGGNGWASAGAALQLSPNNRFHPNRIVFAGYWCLRYGVPNKQTFWWSDDSGKTYHLARNATGGPFLPNYPVGETALAETPEGGILTSSRNSIFHGPGKCDCRATLRSHDGGDTFGALGFDRVLVEPECMATMINGGSPGAMFHSNPGHGTDKENKSPPNGRASGTVRRSLDGGRTWEASVVLNGHNAYSYSCLSRVPQSGFIGLAWETVLPGQHVPRPGSAANNVVFTLIPQNFTNHTPSQRRAETL